MSGLEIAGIVLGAIPLIISGLEHYAEGASTIKRMYWAPKEFRKLARRLEVEHEIFRNNQELLLNDCVDDAVLQGLLENADSGGWSEPAVEAALRQKLHRSYQGYMDTIRDMDKTLTAFRERLQLGDDGKGPFNDPNSFREAFKRFRFGLRRSDYIDLIDEISKENTRLQSLTQQSVALEPARTTRKRIPDFTKIRSNASSMFSMLQTGLGGSCQASHRASLYMRPLETAPGAIAHDEERAFRVVLHHEFKAPCLQQFPSQWMIEEAEVRMLDAIAASTSKTPSSPCPPPAIAKGKKALRFQISTQASPAALPPPPPPPGPSILTPQQQQALDEIKDLCESIQKLRPSKCGVCLGYLRDQSNASRHGLYWPEKPLVDCKTLTSVSLGSLLAGGPLQPSGKLSGADSRKLALALALGVLRLHETPWLTAQWGREDITLFKQNNLILSEHPFVSTDLQSRGKASAARRSPAIRNETLFALGIVLIELCMQQSFDSLHAPEDLNADGTKHAASDFLAATRLVDEVYDKAGKRYGDAVRRCILCEFDQRKATLEDDAFRRAVYDNVIAVLEEDVSQFVNGL